MSEQRLKQLEQDHRQLSTRVDGISRSVDKVKTLVESRKETVCDEHGRKLVEAERNIERVEMQINDLKVQFKNKWPNILASFAGGLFATVPLVILFFQFVMPLIKANNAVAGG